ncbi:MAG: ATP-binding cassette domain-containing protein [Anaerolineales bacterium]|nr:ATP-binding cassette domain-containing protein [Anaerolineales bacterium]
MPQIQSNWKKMELIIDGVSKRYKGNVWALRDFTLTLKPGLLGLLGPNGAGKTTLMRILATVLKPTKGSVMLNGIDITEHPNEMRKVLGYLPQDFGVYKHLNAVEFLLYLASVRGLNVLRIKDRIDQLLEMVNLDTARKQPLGQYSGGMKQRLGIAQAILNDPQVLIVDEPTAGLDPTARVRFRNLLAELSADRIVILSTHIVSDVESAAAEIAIIHHGRLSVHSSPDELMKNTHGKVWEVVVSSSELSELKESFIISGSTQKTGGTDARVIHEKPPIPKAQPLDPSLEDAYLYHLSRDEVSDAEDVYQ